MGYLNRIIEKDLIDKMSASGAVLIKGPKSCGKTLTAKQFAKSVLEMDRDKQVPVIMATNPRLLLIGDAPRLIDEWQEQPEIWNYIRHEVDDRKTKGQFILTGSAHPNDDVKLHSGAGRFTVVQMDTMTWQELGYSTGLVKVSELLQGTVPDFFAEGVSLEFIINKMLIGGWPTLLNQSQKNAIQLNCGYIDLLCEADMSRATGVKRDPRKVRSLMRSIARNTATLVDNKTLEQDVKTSDRNELSRNTIAEYLDALSRLMILYEQPAFNPHIRSAASLRKAPKRHLCDTSLATAVLGLDEEALMRDLNYTGFLFESLATHELNVYAKANDAHVFHYLDSYGLEVDAIVQKRNGDYAAFEIKLGVGYIEAAAENLKKFAINIDTTKMELPKSLNIITGTGMSYRRPDGINVISLASLGA
ncbi:MAG: ATP-binding protein [Saprospiraceae bacterium]|jgi:predicted AAA+ superfamily ATPase|nr:ATP-binding protein [Saprospiraceae bacterium]